MSNKISYKKSLV